MSDKWIDFEEQLAFIVCSGIAKAVTKEYWTALKEIFYERTKNETFLRALGKINDV